MIAPWRALFISRVRSSIKSEALSVALFIGYDVRAEVVEKNGTLKVALVEETILGAPDECTEEALYKNVKVKTKAKASTLKVQQLPKSQVHLNKKITSA